MSKRRTYDVSPKGNQWTVKERDADTGRFLDQKADPDPFKVIRKETRK